MEASPAAQPPPLHSSDLRPALLPAAVLFAITILVNLPLLHSTPLAGTEGHRAITAEQMIREGNWIVPKLFDRYYLAKPPMQYWLIALSHFIAGAGNTLVWRMPAIIAAGLLNAILCLFAGRWFGRTAGWVAGWAGFGLIALWGQIPSADVDSVDTFFAILAALTMLELLLGKAKSAIVWTVLAGISTGAMLLTKGPVGFLPIAGVLLWGVIVSARRGVLATLAPPNRLGARWSAAIAAVLIGLGIFSAWVAFAHWKVRHGNLPPDYEGVSEGLRRLTPDWRRYLKALPVPFEMFAFTLPISLGLLLLPLAAEDPRPDSSLADASRADPRRLVTALAGATLLSWGVALLTATENPRWVYTTLPLLCPLAGAVAVGGFRLSGDRRRGVAAIFSGSILAYAAATAVFSFLVQREFPAEHHAILICWCATAAAAITAILACVALWAHRFARAGAFAAITLVLTTGPFTLRDRINRTRVSGYQAVPQLEAIIGRGSTIGAGRVVVSEPELLYYAGEDVRHFVTTTTATGQPLSGPATCPGFEHGWVIGFSDEFNNWRKQGTIRDQHQFRVGKTDIVCVGWFDVRK